MSSMDNLQITEDKRSSIIRKKHHRLIFALRVMLLLLFMFAFFFSCLPLGRAMIRSALVLPALLSASQPELLIASGDPIQHTQTTIPSPSGTVNLDIYQPTAQSPLINSARSGVLIIPGVGDNRRDPQLINLSETMARAGLVVMD